MKNLVVGIDVGGTNIKFGLVNRRGEIICRKALKTKDYHPRSRLISAIVQQVLSLLREAGEPRESVRGIGIGLPGLIDVRAGVVKLLPNVPGWNNVPLKKILQQRLGIMTRLENDVNLIALGEWKYGAGKGARSLICVTLGTGVGGGLILDNQLYRGEGFAAGEIGHMPLKERGPACSCGGQGCFERYVGNQALQRRAAQLFRDPAVTLEEVTRLAGRGDKRALAFWQETGVVIGHGLTGVVNLLNPSLIVIGGGVANSQRFLFPAIRATVKQRAMPVQGRMFRIRKARLGNDAGIVGARVLIEEGQP